MRFGLLLLLCFGCHRSHGNGRPDGGVFDGHLADGSARPDGDTFPEDAGVTLVPPVASGPLPPLPPSEPPPSPDERPSDGGGDGEWLPEPSEDGPSFGRCCQDEPIVDVSTSPEVLTPPVVAWDGARWLVAWGEGPAETPRVAMRLLDERAQPLGAVRHLPGFSGTPEALTYGQGRFGLLLQASPDGVPRVVLTVLDSELRVRANHLVDRPGLTRAVGRHPSVGGWIVAHTTGTNLTFDAISDDMNRVARHDVAGVAGRVELVDFKGRVVAVYDDGTRVHVQSFSGALEPIATQTLPEVPGEYGPSAAFSASRVRDRAFLTVRGHTDEGIPTFVFDPFEDAPIQQLDRWYWPGPSSAFLSSAGNDTIGAVAHCGQVQPTAEDDRFGSLHVVLQLAESGLVADGVVVGGTFLQGCAIAPGADWGSYSVLWMEDAGDPFGMSRIRARYMPLVSAEQQREYEASL
ncbi:MAG: hypothetical protein KC586_14995 [Myxococcales bacterium]|nr:hypothetical protein [Myxococcales bacterium]